MNATRTQMPPTPRLANMPPRFFRQENIFFQRLLRFALSLTPFEGWTPLLLLALALGCVVYSIIQADWVKSSNLLTLGAMMGLLVGLVIAKIPRLYQIILHMGACLIGYWWAVWITCKMAYHVPWGQLIMALRSVLMGSLGAGDVQTSEMVFFFYLTFLCFFLGYFGGWLVYRVHLPWLVVLVYCTITLVNLNYARSDLFMVIVVQFVALLLLVARLQLASQILVWKQEGLYTDRSWLKAITKRCMGVATILTICVVLMSSIVPVGGQVAAGERFWGSISNIVDNIGHGNISLDNLTGLLRPYQTPTTFFSDQLTISGSVILPTGEVLRYQSEDGGPHYLEGFTYSQFDGHTWKSSLTEKDAQTYAANATLPSEAKVRHLPTVKTIVTMIQMPGGNKQFIFAPPQPRNFSVSTVVYRDITASSWTQQQPIMPGVSYEVISEPIPGNPESVGAIGLPLKGESAWGQDSTYQNLINTGYISMPKNIDARVKETANEIVKSSNDAWSALKALEGYFNASGKFSYSITNDPIPGNVDVVTWLLQTHKGYCTYYASAMAIMARYLNIPTRIVNGFNQGIYDSTHNQWVVSGNNAHSWVQAYLPNAGWVDFDPTPGFSPSGSGNVSAQPTPEATPSLSASTPTATNTSTALPPLTNQNDPTQLNPDSNQGRMNAFVIWATILMILGATFFLLWAIVSRWWKSLYAQYSPISSTFWRLSLFAGWFGMGPQRSQTPYEYSLYLSQRIPQRRSLFLKLADLFVRERWGPPQNIPSYQEQEAVSHVWPLLRSAVLSSLWRKKHPPHNH